MESDGTDLSTSSVPLQLVYVRTYMCRQQNSSHINDTLNKEVYTTRVRTSVHVYCAHAAGVSREGTKCIGQAANNAGQPCQWPSHQIHRMSRGTPPWTTDQNRLQGARLWLHHHQSQRGGPPSWGQGTQQWQDGRPQNTRERHFVLSAMNDWTSSKQITNLYIHTCMVHCRQFNAYSIRTAIHTTYVRTLQVPTT